MASSYSFRVSNILLHALRIFTVIVFAIAMLVSHDQPLTGILSANAPNRGSANSNRNNGNPK
jgi:hypothetical protein